MVAISKKESRVLARAIIALFRHWQLPSAVQCDLLGLSPTSRSRLSAMATGVSGIPRGRDRHERVAYLLSIHQYLRLLYPHNPELRYGWVSMRNKRLSGLSPVEVMTQEGYIGIAKIKRYLAHSINR